MILLLNGDSHTAAAECVNGHGWAMDDGLLYELGRAPHPDNEAVSFGAVLGNLLGVDRINISQAGSSNQRIIRTTREWIENNPGLRKEVFVLLQWSTWEREEWFWQGEWLQVNASGLDTVPEDLQERYRHFIVSIDWPACTKRAHSEILRLHNDLTDLAIPHLMFNGNSHFGDCAANEPMVPVIDRPDWQNCYIDPYNATGTYSEILRQNGFQTVNGGYHFGKEAHCFWARFLLQYINDNQLLMPHEISADRQH